jgi:hypothetical protein
MRISEDVVYLAGLINSLARTWPKRDGVRHLGMSYFSLTV